MMDKITTHLEFLGYKIEPLKGDFDGLLATNSKYLNFMYQEKGYSILFTYLLQTKDIIRKDRPGALNTINVYNNKALVSRCYMTEDSNFVILEATYPLSYDKTTFGLFVEAIQHDSMNAYNEEIGLKKYIS